MTKFFLAKVDVVVSPRRHGFLVIYAQGGERSSGYFFLSTSSMPYSKDVIQRLRMLSLNLQLQCEHVWHQ